MKGNNTWSYRPYRPLDTAETLYICRLVPGDHWIHIEWLPDGASRYRVWYRRREEESFCLAVETGTAFCEINGLDTGVDYAVYIESERHRSRVRLARCGESVGTVVNYLHPDDEAYAYSGRYLCSPSLLRHPDGYLLASMDLFASGQPQNLTLIFRSDDNGQSWHYLCELMPCFWGKLFLHRGEVYMLACSTEYGDLLIGRSPDGGAHFDAPVALLRGSNGKGGHAGVHKNPQNIVRFGGRIYETLEWGSWSNKEYGHAAMVMSCREEDDLLDPENWHFTPPRRFDHFDRQLDGLPLNTMTIEGTLVVDPDGRLLNVMRFGMYQKALVYAVNTEDPDAPLSFERIMDFPGNYSKFMIRRDAVSGQYYSVATRVYDPQKTNARNLLSLLRSSDLRHWEVAADLLDRREQDARLVGFQYVDFFIEGEDILFLCRTAQNGAHSYHDSNYSTFHRIRHFRTHPQLA